MIVVFNLNTLFFFIWDCYRRNQIEKFLVCVASPVVSIFHNQTFYTNIILILQCYSYYLYNLFLMYLKILAPIFMHILHGYLKRKFDLNNFDLHLGFISNSQRLGKMNSLGYHEQIFIILFQVDGKTQSLFILLFIQVLILNICSLKLSTIDYLQYLYELVCLLLILFLQFCILTTDIKPIAYF